MDRVSQLRGEAGGSGDSTLDTTAAPSEDFMSANENSSKYFSINDSTFDITPIKDVSLASTSADADRAIADDELISNLSPIAKKELDSYKIGKQIEAANILSGGVDIFEDNSFDGDELVIDDNAQDKVSNEAELLPEVLPLENVEPEPALVDLEANVANKEMEVVLQIDGTNLNAIDIGNGLYLYRKDGQDELAAIQITDDDPHQNFKFLKVRDNAEGNLEVYEEIEIEVSKEVPTKGGKPLNKNSPRVPKIEIKSKCASSTNSKVQVKTKSLQNEPIPSTSKSEKSTEKSSTELKTEANGKLTKLSESKKSPVVGSFTPMTYHSTPNKEGKPLTKTMVDFQLDPNRHSDNVKKTIEVHTDNIKQKSGEALVKEKEVEESVKTVEITEKNNKTENKEDEKRGSDKEVSEKVQKDSDAVKGTELSAIISKTEDNTIAEQPESEILSKGNKKNSSNIKEDITPIVAIPVKEKSPISNKQNDHIILHSDTVAPLLFETPKEDNKMVESTVTSETIGKAEVLCSKLEVGEFPIKLIAKPLPNIIEEKENVINQSAESEVTVVNPAEANNHRNETSPAENSDQNCTAENASKIKVCEGKSPDKKSEESENKDSLNVDDDVVKFSLESFPDVSSTCAIGSEESKEESITLYSIDTDESVSLITPSSSIKPTKEKEILKEKISEVLTTISNFSSNQTEVGSADIDNSKPPLSVVKELIVQSSSKDKPKSCSQVGFQENLPKSSEAKSIEITEEAPKKSSKLITEPKDLEKTTGSTPVLKVQESTNSNFVSKAALFNIVPHVAVSDLKSVKETQPLAPELVQPTEQINKSETKPLPEVSKVIPAAQVKTMEMPVEPVATPHMKELSQPIKPASKTDKFASKPLEKVGVSSTVIGESKYAMHVVKASQEIDNIKTIPAEVKQSGISSTSTLTTNIKPVKAESHIPIVSIANKPSLKHIPVTALKNEKTAKPTDVPDQKEDVRNNAIAKKPIVTKIEIIEPKARTSSISKPVNNNHAPAVPFGKWTDAHRQEFLNKFKEVKAPVNTNSKQIKNSNDLNRRDVLQKIDSQRAQTINNAAIVKAQEKSNVKTESMFSSKVASPIMQTKIPKNEIIDNNPNVHSKVSMKQENLQTTSSNVTTSFAPGVNIEKISKLKAPPNSQTSLAKMERPKEPKVTTKLEPRPKHQTSVLKSDNIPREQNTSSCYMASLIDRTIEGMISKIAPSKYVDEQKQTQQVTVTSEPDRNTKKINLKPELSKPTLNEVVSLDEIEMKMNELHGIPFVERPAHELPKIPKAEVKTYSKADNVKLSNTDPKTASIPNLPKLVKDVESDDEVIEHEPVTGDIELKEREVPEKLLPRDKNNLTETNKNTPAIKEDSKKDAEIITEKDFDKFARRNSVPYENCLTVNFDHKEQPNVVQIVREKDVALKINTKPDFLRTEVTIKQSNKQPIKPDFKTEKSQGAAKNCLVSDSSNKKYQSKIHSAYQSAITAKHQVSRPISIIEDKPVKVVFLESNERFVPNLLNVQGQELSPAKKPVQEADTTADNDSLDSVILEDNEVLINKQYEVREENKQDKFKTKHQRKQVLTPVEAPDIELIQPSDIGIESPSKKKRKLEDIKVKNVVPKKSYLLNRNTTTEDKRSNSQPLLKHPAADTKLESKDIPEHSNAATAIDNLVKAAELLDNEAEMNNSVTSNPDPQLNIPVKRGRGRPRKYPLPEGMDSKTPSPQKKPRLIDAKPVKQDSASDEQDDDSIQDEIVLENWTMGKINENIVCPICNKLFRSENVVFKHVKHCTGVSPNRSDSGKRSPRRSRLSQDSENTDIEYNNPNSDSKNDIPKRRRSKESLKSEAESEQPKFDLDKDDVIVIEDTPIKDKPIKDKEEELKRVSKAKIVHRNMSLVCELCGKSFRQQSYLLSHKLQHKKESGKKNEINIQNSKKQDVFSCEVCKKEFRKLHHLVQHRINHNPDSAPKRTLRKSSSEQAVSKNLKEDAAVKQNDDASAGFRCEPCDKSFRKLHHLVEHRGTHEGINRQKLSPPQPTAEKSSPSPQCEICKKTFRKLHHLIEHKEQHAETNSDKSDDKSSKCALSTKDIIHECSLCYMVFPNEHSLNKHFVNCLKKKRQSKQLKSMPADESGIGEETINLDEKNDDKEDVLPKVLATEIIEDKEHKTNEVTKSPIKVEEQVLVAEIKEIKSKEITQTTVVNIPVQIGVEKTVELHITPDKKNISQSDVNKEKEKLVVPEKVKKNDLTEVKSQDIPKKKVLTKDKSNTPNVTKRPKSLDTPAQPAAKIKTLVESSDDDEIRYMFNPKFKIDNTSESKTFMKVRAKKRNSLQIERPSSNDVAKRRTSLQHPPKIPRLKPKPIEVKSKAIETKPKNAETKSKVPQPITKSEDTKSKVTDKSLLYPPNKLKHLPKISETEATLSTDSDDSDVKYSFPKTAPEVKPVPEKTVKDIANKVPRKSLVDKRKSLGSIAKRKSLGKAVTAKHKDTSLPTKPIKKRWSVVEHRCDCGQLFSSAALLSRHTSVAHTPPRIRRRRDPPEPQPQPAAPPPPPKQKPTPNKSTLKPTRKSSTKKTEQTPDARKTNKSTETETHTARKTRRTAHSGVPVPEKMRRFMKNTK